MTPTLPDILLGQAISLSAPQPPESSGDYMVGRLGLLAMLAVLASQEAERGTAARVWENDALRSLFVKSVEAYDTALGGALRRAASTGDHELAWSALDAANAELRRLLIRLHEAAELRGDGALDREILTLYQAMAKARRLELPAALAG
jgi:hypothetical protein